MTRRPKDPSAMGPIDPKERDGCVEIQDPPPLKMTMSPEEADLSAIRLLDAAATARKATDRGRKS